MTRLSTAERTTIRAVVTTLLPPRTALEGREVAAIGDLVCERVGSDWGHGHDSYRRPPFEVPKNSGLGWQSETTIFEVVRTAVDLVDTSAIGSFGSAFADITAEQQTAVLGRWDASAVEIVDGIDSHDVVDLFLDCIFTSEFVHTHGRRDTSTSNEIDAR